MALDAVEHHILLKKLDYYGFKNQFVSLNGYNSNLANGKCGVPQNSIMPPTLLLTYINDLHVHRLH